MSGLVIFLLIISLLPITFWYSIYLDKKELDKAEKEDIMWLNNETRQPKYVIMFGLKDPNGINTIKQTGIFEPTNSLAGNPWNIRYTSKGLAEIYLRKSYESGFFIDKEGITYPTSNIGLAWVQRINL